MVAQDGRRQSGTSSISLVQHSVKWQIAYGLLSRMVEAEVTANTISYSATFRKRKIALSSLSRMGDANVEANTIEYNAAPSGVATRRDGAKLTLDLTKQREVEVSDGDRDIGIFRDWIGGGPEY